MQPFYHSKNTCFIEKIVLNTQKFPFFESEKRESAHFFKFLGYFLAPKMALNANLIA
jgi:hypothetical protein